MNQKDPHSSREAERYANPIASREFILSMITEADQALTARQIAGRLSLTSPEDKKALKSRLGAMLRSGQLAMNQRSGYRLPNPDDMPEDAVEGVISAHPDGFGFLMVPGEAPDIYLNHQVMRRVMHGDKVLARISAGLGGRRPEAEIERVLTRAFTSIAGRIRLKRKQIVLEPLSRKVHQPILLEKDPAVPLKNGQIAVAIITDYGDRGGGLKGRVERVIADDLTPEIEIEVVLKNHDLPRVFPEDVVAEADAIKMRLAPADLKHRDDLRHLPFVTIDGSDARDFDDAVLAKVSPEGFTLWVAIADVAHYVRPGRPLYDEAVNRGTSVYFPQMVIPMLPEKLSNGLCSLRPNEDRLVLVCEMSFDTLGRRLGYRFSEAVIESKARLIYEDVAHWLDHKAAPSELAPPVLESLEALHQVYQVLLQRRAERGALEIETPELRVQWDDAGKLSSMGQASRTEAHKLIEECMLAANVAMADFIQATKGAGLYRVHDEPDPESVTRLAGTLAQFGLALDADLGRVTTQDFQRILDASRGQPAAAALQMLVLRSMNQAIYTPEHRPHFCLNYPVYAHFTSPIRRLADLVNHQLVKSQLRKKAKHAPSELKPEAQALLTELGERASMTERRADAAVYEVLEWLKCEYLKQFLGDTFEGVITTAVKFGLFVTLEPIMAEGLIHIGNLKQDHFKFDAELGALVGTRSHQILRMGDRVVVQLESVDSSLGQVSLALSEHVPLARKGQSAGRRTSASKVKKAKQVGEKKPKKRGKRER